MLNVKHQLSIECDMLPRFPGVRPKDTTVHRYLSKQRHILLEEGYVEEHRKVVEEGELQKERTESDGCFFFLENDLPGRKEER